MKHIFDDSDKNKYEAYTKEEVLAVIQEAISSGELPDEINGLVLTFKNPIDNLGYKVAFCTQAKYNELEAAGTLEGNCYYYIIDDTSYDDIIDTLEELTTNLNDLDLREANDVSALDSRVTTLEGKHLYRHDLKMEGTGTSVTDSSVSVTYEAHISFYSTNSSSNITVIGDIIYFKGIDANTETMASGFVQQTGGTNKFVIYSATIAPNYASRINFACMSLAGVFVTIQTGASETITFTDQVTQCY